MKTSPAILRLLVILCTLTTTAVIGQTASGWTGASAKAIPWDQISAKAGADHHGDGLQVMPTAEGARLHCVFQRLDGEATRQGLWLTSTLTNGLNDRFRVRAVEAGRHRSGRVPGIAPRHPGEVSVDGLTARWSRPGLVEEYSVSLDGVRQDFVVSDKPPGEGELQVRLEVMGAEVEAMAGGARLVLKASGRKIAYSRLHATDAMGRELAARMEVLTSDSESNRHKAELAIVVNDAGAVYPVRIDPTFSDANWISMGGVSGANTTVLAAVVDGAGNLYIGGNFTLVGKVEANRIAKWNGNAWSALGSGVNSQVRALAVSHTDVYAGGFFTTAGGIAANRIAKWNGSAWSALGSGMDNTVMALAVSEAHLYAGGAFTNAGGSAADYVAKWDGNGWSVLGTGLDHQVYALTASATDVYAGGYFSTAGSNMVNYIAKWNGSEWSALGTGMDNPVYALAISGSDLYAGGDFARAGGSGANHIAKWDGSTWTTWGAGLGSSVRALAVSGADLYVGGFFSSVNGIIANHIAKWNGTEWSALGSGVDAGIWAVAVSGSNVYVGGDFSKAGDTWASHVAQWNGTEWLSMDWGVSDTVLALAVLGSDVYAGGWFNTAGSSPAHYIAKWNGSEWSPLGSGMNTFVRALAVSGSNLYAGGAFTNAGGTSANYIAKWDGSNWSALGPGRNNWVIALAVSGSNVYAGGSATNYIAKWDGYTLCGRGTLTVANPGRAQSAGNMFTLFTQPLQKGAAPAITGAGATRANNLAVDGRVTVTSVNRPTLDFTQTGNSLQYSFTLP